LVLRTLQKQRKCLTSLSTISSMPTTALCSLTRDQLRAALEALHDEDLIAVGVSPTSSAMRLLRSTGAFVSSFGQFTAEQRMQVQDFLQQSLGAATAASEIGDPELDNFVSFIRAYPGRIYQEDAAQHHKLLAGVMFSRSYVVIPRSVVECFTNHRYFTDRWERTFPLITFNGEGGDSILRQAGMEEFSRFRSNNFSYLDSHGMGISSGGIAEGLSSYGSLAYELGVALPTDENAKLGNWFAGDFEKILNEVVALNPAGDSADILPGEAFHEVCQNPADASSISATQHTQISRGSTSLWPVMRLEMKPVHVSKLNATLDLIQVGDEADAFMVCLDSPNIASPGIVAMLQELRLALCREFGGRSIVFTLLASPRGDGTFRAALVPNALLTMSHEAGTTVNALGEDISKYRIPVPTVDAASAKGSISVDTLEGLEQALHGSAMLGRLYDFNRVPGARRFVSDFLHRSYSYVAAVPGRCQKITQGLIPGGNADPPRDVFFPVGN